MVDTTTPVELPDALETALRRFEYAATERDDVATHLEDCADRLADVVSEPGLTVARQRVVSPDVAAALSTHYGCVEVIVGSELDADTPGKRGLGRVSTSIPRLGGAVPGVGAAEVSAAIGPMMERLCIAGFASGAAYDALTDDGPSRLCERSESRMLEAWIPDLAAGIGTESQSILAIYDALSDQLLDDLTACAREHGVLKGFRSGRKKEQLTTTALLLLTAGANLFFLGTSLADDRFEQAEAMRSHLRG